MTSNDIKSAMKQSLHTKKRLRLHEFAAEYYQTFKKELTQICPQMIHKIKQSSTKLNVQSQKYTNTQTTYVHNKKGKLQANFLEHMDGCNKCLQNKDRFKEHIK